MLASLFLFFAGRSLGKGTSGSWFRCSAGPAIPENLGGSACSFSRSDFFRGLGLREGAPGGSFRLFPGVPAPQGFRGVARGFVSSNFGFRHFLISCIFKGWRRGNRDHVNRFGWGLFALALVALFFRRPDVGLLPARCGIMVLWAWRFPVIGIRSLFIAIWCVRCWHGITSFRVESVNRSCCPILSLEMYCRWVLIFCQKIWEWPICLLDSKIIWQ